MDGGYAMTGRIEDVQGTSSLWLLKVDRDGGLQFSANPYEGNRGPTGYSLIQTDDGGYLIGGISHENGRQFGVTRTDDEGEEIWCQNYGGGSWDKCYAVIELKSGEFLLAGETRSFGAGDFDGYLIKIDGDGEVLWAHTYGTEIYEGFRAVRELDGGAVAAGRIGPYNDYWLVRVDEDGEEVWSQSYGNENVSEGFGDMTSCREGGFILCGYVRNGNEAGFVYLVRVSSDGDIFWEARHETYQNNPNICGITQLWDNGYVIVGGSTFFMRVDAAGNLMWSGYANAPGSCYLMSVVPTPEGGMIAAGSTIIHGNENPSNEALLINLIPDRSPPQIVGMIPDNPEFSILRGDSVFFDVDVIDLQEDSILYVWQLDDEEVSTDTSVVISFPELGDCIVKCIVSDGDLSDSCAWLVHVCEFYITGYSPDSLDMTIRRGSSIDFALDIAAVEDIELNYLWILTDRNRRREEVGETDSITVNFDLAGDFQLEGFVWRGEESDNVNWSIHVRSAIWYWWPREDSLTVPVDTTLLFAITPFNPDSESLEYLWMLDGDTINFEQEIEILFEEMGLHEVVAYVHDGCEADTIRWEVTVIPSVGAPEPNAGLLPTEPTLYPLVPNPFNSQVQISFYLPNIEFVKLTVFDLNGRNVNNLTSSILPRGRHKYKWNATNFSTGVYLIGLETNSTRITRKVVFVK